jgi:hypothetical protein
VEVCVVTRPGARALALALALECAGCAQSVDWNAKEAYRLCAGAISNWPATQAPPCDAMSMCANEAPLTPAQASTLAAMISDSGCDRP